MTIRKAEVAFLIANDRHHTTAALAVIRALRETGDTSCRVLSLAEFRGFDSPVDRFREQGVPIDPLVPFRFRKPSTGQSKSSNGDGSSRSLLRSGFWRALLAPNLKESLSPTPSLVVVPNDGAYPYNRICRLLTELEIPFLVLQEGIRFATPIESQEGRSGAAAWAVWGETSARYFLDQGAPSANVHITGSPRFDELLSEDWSREAEALRQELSGGKPIVTLLSNPIDDLGMVTKAEKLDLIRRLATAAVPVLERRGWHLVIKLHGRESRTEVDAVLRDLTSKSPVSVVSDCPLYPLLHAARGALMFASSVGLEALLCNTPLALAEVPGHGFAHDFVSSGAARGITWDSPIQEQLESWWLEQDSRRSAVERYLDKSVADRKASAKQVAMLIRQLVRVPE